MESWQEFGFGLIRALQTMSPRLDGLMHFISFLGSPEFYMAIVPIIYWAFNKRLGRQLTLILAIAFTLSWVLKLAFHQPRPYWLGGVQGMVVEMSYGIPSGHATLSCAFWGFLAIRLRRPWLWIFGGALVIAIGISRLYLGAHFPHDVLFGWLIAGLTWWLFARFEHPVAVWARKRTVRGQVGASFALSIGILLIGWVMLALLAGTPDPAAWSAFSAQARAPESGFFAAGGLFGALAGFALMRRFADFNARGGRSQRFGRCAIGIAGMVAVYAGLGLLFGGVAAPESGLALALLYVRYAAVNLWVAFGAVWVFLKLRLAAPSERSPLAPQTA